MIRKREMFTTTISKDLKVVLKEYSDKTMIPMSKIVEVSLRNYMHSN
ncbi:MAG: ribbon-helix-helix domain-containing protein [Fusobacteria bacterium]|nr:ribbon-helix-helix domain-containing protein [Fusobacteriota bacterium]